MPDGSTESRNEADGRRVVGVGGPQGTRTPNLSGQLVGVGPLHRHPIVVAVHVEEPPGPPTHILINVVVRRANGSTRAGVRNQN